MSIYIDTEWASLSKYEEELSGDHVEVVRTDDAVVAVLADGLGSGVKANILATLTAKIIATMVKNGATLERRLKPSPTPYRSAKKGTWPIPRLPSSRSPGKAEVTSPSLTIRPSFLYGPENSSTLTGKNGQLKVGKSGKAGFKSSREMSW